MIQFNFYEHIIQKPLNILNTWSWVGLNMLLLDLTEPCIFMSRSLFKLSCLFLRPRPWQFEIWDSTDKQATYLLLGFETLNLKFCDLKLWKQTVFFDLGTFWGTPVNLLSSFPKCQDLFPYLRQVIRSVSIFSIFGFWDSNLRVSNPNKLIVDVFLTWCRISMCQGLGPKKHDKISEIDRYLCRWVCLWSRGRWRRCPWSRLGSRATNI